MSDLPFPPLDIPLHKELELRKFGDMVKSVQDHQQLQDWLVSLYGQNLFLRETISTLVKGYAVDSDQTVNSI